MLAEPTDASLQVGQCRMIHPADRDRPVEAAGDEALTCAAAGRAVPNQTYVFAYRDVDDVVADIYTTSGPGYKLIGNVRIPGILSDGRIPVRKWRVTVR